MKLQIGIGALRNYQRLPYKTWEALAEFVDNAIQAYENNADVLDSSFAAQKTSLEILITADRQSDKIVISDNSFGMTKEVLEAAMVIGSRPTNDAGLSEYGMGMKTAAIWFGNSWKITTKVAGERVAHEVKFKMPSAGDDTDASSVDIKYQEIQQNNELHYTTIEITDLQERITGQSISKVKRNLGSIYRFYIRSGKLKLSFNGEPCEFTLYDDSGDAFHKKADGAPWRQTIQPFSIQTVDTKGHPITASIHGWAGLLDPGSRANSGFSLIRRGRVLQGWPDAWKPNPPFGDQEGGSNTSLNQRLVGEIFLDDRMATDHTKSQPKWHDNDESDIAQHIYKALIDLVGEGKKTWGKRKNLSSVEVERAVDEAVLGFANSSFGDSLKLIDVPAPSIIAASNDLTMKKTGGNGLLKALTLPGQGDGGKDLTVRQLYSQDLSVNDPFLVIEAGPNELDLLINSQHPYFSAGMANGGEAFLVEFIRSCLFDGLAEWKARRHGVSMEPETIRMIKNSMMLSIGILDEAR